MMRNCLHAVAHGIQDLDSAPALRLPHLASSLRRPTHSSVSSSALAYKKVVLWGLFSVLYWG